MEIQELLIYWRVIKKRLWLIGLLVGTTLAAMLILSYLSKPVYKATTSFQVTTPLPAEVSLFQEFRTSSSRDELRYTRNNFLTVVESRYVVGQVIEELDLAMDIDELQESMVIEPEEDSDFIKLEIVAENPQMAASIANALIDNAARYFGELSAGSLTANKEFIQQQLQEVKGDLDAARAALIQFQLESRIGSISQVLSSQHVLIRELSLQRDEELAKGNQEITNSYDQVIAQRERQLQDLILISAEYETLYDTVERIEATYSNLLDKETEAKLKENEILSARFIRVIPAREPSRPLSHISAKIFLLGGIVSLVLGIMIVFALEYSERTSAAISKDEASMRKSAIGP
ncbi:MAG: Wzz/FepE/Etk N-terminal domain-containing protein [Chloroflexota bacterium]|nr:Wzz/FepE/Etk N-terminal domain-containing protein [Chloroflexota bacterium]